MLSKKLFSICATTILYLLLLSASCKKASTNSPVTPPADPSTTIAVPLGGNAFITNAAAAYAEQITDNRLTNWNDAATIISTYFRIGQAGQLHIAVKANAVAGNSSIKVLVNGTAFTLNLSGSGYKTYFAGTVSIANAGYVKVDLQGISKTGSYFADVSDIMIGGAVTATGIYFANDPANYYWSRRGPSVHLSYNTPANTEWFYNEVTVPAGEDKIGSYFMANGFDGGYFGMQVKSETERWLLFSVWDPATGSGTAQATRTGTDVVAQRFGGEGTGGQAYLIYNWKAGTTYKFLTQSKPDGAGNTDFSSWFYAPELNAWLFMATWKRPATNTYLTGVYSFLENFDVQKGYLGRQAQYGNQWACNTSGTWSEITTAKFTADATAKNNQRFDYAGGVKDGQFYLQNCGFFAAYVNYNTDFTRPATNQQPTINFADLP